MIIRVLPPNEYPRLAAVEEGYVPDPNNAVVLVAEEDGEIVGRWFLVVMPHVEGIWIRPDKRGGTLGYRLEKAMCTEAKDAGLERILAFADNDTHVDYMTRLGWKKLPFTVMTKEF